MLMEWSALVNMMMEGTWIIMNHGPYLLRMILGDLKINTKSSFYEDESAPQSLVQNPLRYLFVRVEIPQI